MTGKRREDPEFYQPLVGLPAFGWFTSLWLGQITIAPEVHMSFAKVSPLRPKNPYAHLICRI